MANNKITVLIILHQMNYLMQKHTVIISHKIIYLHDQSFSLDAPNAM
jgi:hypothetical protein